MDIIIQEGMIVGKTLGKNKKGCGTHDYLTGTILPYIVKKFQVGGCNNGWTHHQAKPTYLRYLYLPST